MGSVILFLLSFLMISGVSSQSRILQQGCQLCMNTYRSNCTVCYDICNDNKTLNQCTNYVCSQKDADQICTKWDAVTLNSSNCLGTCCSGFLDSATLFTETNFNLCIQRDAASMTNSINKGLTLGLVLGLLALLFLAGLTYQLGLLCFDDKVLDDDVFPTTRNEDTKPPLTSAENIGGLANKRGEVNDIWQTQGLIVNGYCPLCNRDGINIVADCQHGFHYDCLSKRASQFSGQPACPLCGLNGSLRSAKIYCSVCRQYYKMFNSGTQKLDPIASSAMHNIKCPNCS